MPWVKHSVCLHAQDSMAALRAVGRAPRALAAAMQTRVPQGDGAMLALSQHASRVLAVRSPAHALPHSLPAGGCRFLSSEAGGAGVEGGAAGTGKQVQRQHEICISKVQENKQRF